MDFFKLFYPLSRVEKKKKKIPPYISPKRKKRKDDIPVLNNFFLTKKISFPCYQLSTAKNYKILTTKRLKTILRYFLDT